MAIGAVAMTLQNHGLEDLRALHMRCIWSGSTGSSCRRLTLICSA
jgi:hypothetical protein